jgi:hypothetical protein
VGIIRCRDSRKRDLRVFLFSAPANTKGQHLLYLQPEVADRYQYRVLRYNNYTSMISGRIGCELAVVAVLCVLTIFLFPGMQGPYSVVHGPVTALLAARAATRLRTAIVQAAFRSLGHCLISPLVALSWASLAEADFFSLPSPERNAILRC